MLLSTEEKYYNPMLFFSFLLMQRSIQIVPRPLLLSVRVFFYFGILVVSENLYL